MSHNEFTGKTVKEAIEKACQELGVEETLLEVQVVAESTRGFLGLVGQKDARIRVRKRDILKEVMEAEEAPQAIRNTRSDNEGPPQPTVPGTADVAQEGSRQES